MASIATSIELYDKMSAPLNNIMNALNMTISSIYDLKSEMASSVATTSLDAVTQSANEAREAIASLGQPPNISIPTIEWSTSGVDVFTTSGIDRYQQEVAATNQMLASLIKTQEAISQKASAMDILPDGASQDINALAQRVVALNQRIQQISNNEVNFGTDTANAELESIRSRLGQALQAQQSLNSAIDQMDVSAANTAYIQLSSTIGSAEQQIRDNANAQGEFNRQVNEAAESSNKLLGTIGKIATAYVSIQGIKSAISASDELTSTTARVDNMNSSFNQINGTAIETEQVMQGIYQAAQSARGSFSDMASVVARFGNNARDAFSSQAEVIEFAEIIGKQMTIAGASTQEANAALLQLSQGLGAGALRGDELNSVFEQAPNLIQSIADYMGVPIGQIKELASEGALTSDIVKNAIMASADEVNAKFETMPQTFGQAWQSFKNTALMAFTPVLNRINSLVNNQGFTSFVNSAISGLSMVANAALTAFDVLMMMGTWIAENWSIIAPIILGIVAALGTYATYLGIVNGIEMISKALQIASAVAMSAKIGVMSLMSGTTMAATAAQLGYNGALYACPIVWIVVLIIALVAALVAVCNWIAQATGSAQSWFGVMTGGLNVVIAFFKNLGLTVANIALGIWNALGAVATNIGVAFNNVISNVQSWFYNLLSTVCTVVAGIAEQLNKLPFVEFDYSGIANAADSYAAKASEAAGNTQEYVSISESFDEGMSTFDTFSDGWASEAYSAGAAWGDGIWSNVTDAFSFDSSDITEGTDTSWMTDTGTSLANTASNTEDIANSAGSIADSVDVSNENLKYLRDLAEAEAVNRFTTAEIKVDMTNNNNVSSTMDIDGMVSSLSAGVLEAMEMAAEGVHS